MIGNWFIHLSSRNSVQLYPFQNKMLNLFTSWPHWLKHCDSNLFFISPDILADEVAKWMLNVHTSRRQTILMNEISERMSCDKLLMFPVLSSTVGECEASAMLPLECQYLNKSALTTLVGPLTPPVKHFQLKRKPKSATLRAELLQKCKLHQYLEASGTFLPFVVCCWNIWIFRYLLQLYM